MRDANKKTTKKSTSWLNKETYDKVTKEISGWPQWKRDAYKQLISQQPSSQS